MEFRILGALEVVDAGRQIDVGGAKQRALLTMLLLEANRVVSTERLIDGLWNESPPEQARKALQVYVSQLRKVLGKERIETQSPGYLVRIAPDELDLARVQALATEGDLDGALALFRGRPLAGFESEGFASAEAARLEELRLTLLENRIDANLERARHASLVGELEALVREQPLRERLRAQLMLALYRSGRQAEALEAFQAARRALVDELGIEPSRELRELHQAILRQDPGLDLERRADPEPTPAPASPPPQTSTPVAAAEERAERKTVTVVHVALGAASRDFSRIDPELLQRLLSQAFAEITATIESHEGSIDAVTGDSVTGVFGLPVVHEDDSLRAARAADEVRSRLTELADELGPERAGILDTRIGVSTGEVLTASTAGFEVRATGAPMTLAAQLAQQAEPGEVTLDETTRRAVANPRGGGRFTSPMVGRGRERRRLNDAFEQAVADRSCQLFTVLGNAGVGKSRLVQEFLADLGEQALVARGRCLPYGEGITFWPLLEAVKDVAALDDSASPEHVISRLVAHVEDDEQPELLARQIAATVGLGDTQVSSEERFTAVLRFLEALGRRRALVVVFDDVQWGEEIFLDLIEHLAIWSRGAPLLLLCLARPELLDVRPTWGGGKLNATSVLLEPLSHDECTQLVSNLVGEAELAEEVAARIAGAAEGNPLFVEEMLSMLIDDGLLVREDGRWAATGDLTAVPVPPTIHALLAARLDQLGGDERSVIEAAAVEGQVFHEGSVVHLASSRSETSTALAALVRKELVRPEPPAFSGERAFRFRNLLIRDAAYTSIPKESRATLHERHVTWLEAKVGAQAVEFDEIVGYHLERASRYRTELGAMDESGRVLGRRAAELLGAAGRRAFSRSDAPAGVNLVSRAVALLSPDDALRVELVPNVRVAQGLSDLSWADRVLTEAVEASATTGDRLLAAHALVQRGFLRLFTDHEVTTQELFDVAERAIAVFEEHGDELGLARAWRLIAQVHYLRRCADRSAGASTRALEHALATDDSFEQREIVEWLGIALWLGPAPAPQASDTCRRLLAEIPADPVLEVNLLGALAYLVAIQGHTGEAEAVIERGSRVMEEVGDGSWVFPIEVALVALWQGDPALTERQLRGTHERLRGMNRSHFCSTAVVLAQAVYAQGRYEEADEYARAAVESADPIEVHSNIVGRSTVAKVLARRGAFEAADQLARDAVAFAAESDFLDTHGAALTDLAEVLRLAGRSNESVVVLEEAIELHERKGNVLAVEKTRTLLADVV